MSVKYYLRVSFNFEIHFTLFNYSGDRLLFYSMKVEPLLKGINILVILNSLRKDLISLRRNP